MSFIIVTADKENKMQFVRITAKSITDALQKSISEQKGERKVVAVIDARYEQALG